MEQAQIDKARNMKAQGSSLRAIAAQIGQPLSAVFRALKGDETPSSEGTEDGTIEGEAMSTQSTPTTDLRTSGNLRAEVQRTERNLADCQSRIESINADIARASIDGPDSPQAQAFMAQRDSLMREQELLSLRVGELKKLIPNVERQEATARIEALKAEEAALREENEKFLQEWNSHVEQLSKLLLLGKSQRHQSAMVRDEAVYLAAYYNVRNPHCPLWERPDIEAIEKLAESARQYFTTPTPNEWSGKLSNFKIRNQKSPFAEQAKE